MLELTSTEVKQLSKDTKVYQGVGKMLDLALSLYGSRMLIPFSFRFVFSPTSDVEKRLSSETAELKSDISNLNKKLHSLELTYKNSREHIEKLMQSGGR